MTTPVFTVEADFDNSGSFETALNDYLPPETMVTVSRGSDRSGRARVSEISLALQNRDGTFTFDNSASALNGLVKPLPPIRVRVDIGASPYTLWSGYIDAIDNEWTLGREGYRARAHLHASDLMKFIARFPRVDVSVADRLSGAAAIAVLAAMGLSGGDYSVDTGIQTLEKHFARTAQGINALLDVVQSEMGGAVWVRADGVVRVEDRHNRLGVSSPDQTWGDGTNIKPRRARKWMDDTDLNGTVSAQVNVRVTGDTTTKLWRAAYDWQNRPTPNPLFLASGGTYGPVRFEVSPFLALVAQEAGYDYAANTSDTGSGTDVTSDWVITVTPATGGTSAGAIDITYKNNGVDSYLLFHQVRGQPADFVGSRPIVSYSKPLSGAKIDAGPSPIAIPFGDDEGQRALDFCCQLARTYRDPYPRLQLEFLWGNDDTRNGMAAIDLGDLIRYTDTAIAANQGGTKTDEWWYVEAVEHRVPVSRRGGSAVTVVTLIPSYLFRNLDRLVFDTFARDDTASTLGTSTSGDAWSGDSNVHIASGKVLANNTSVQIPTVSLGGSGGDMAAEADVAAMAANAEGGVVYRHVDASNYWFAYFSYPDSKVYLKKVVAGVTTTVASVNWTPTAAGRMQAKAQDTRHRVWADGKLVIDTTDSALNTAIRWGLYLKGSTTMTIASPYGQGM